MKSLPPCPLCGSREIRLHYSHGGAGGQMITVSAFAECEECMTVFRGGASSTAGFTYSEAVKRYRELPEMMEAERQMRLLRLAKEAALSEGNQ